MEGWLERQWWVGFLFLCWEREEPRCKMAARGVSLDLSLFSCTIYPMYHLCSFLFVGWPAKPAGA